MTLESFRHVPTGTLERLDTPLGSVFASASTWYRLVQAHNWRRPRQRVHPAKPKLAIRATKANEIWHVDTTILRLLDDGPVYLHAVTPESSRSDGNPIVQFTDRVVVARAETPVALIAST